jgi:hypothetical protein
VHVVRPSRRRYALDVASGLGPEKCLCLRISRQLPCITATLKLSLAATWMNGRLCVEVAALSRTKPRRALYFFGPIHRWSEPLK